MSDPMRASMDVVKGLIEHSITHAPRSLQTTIGPSEIGTDCDHCLAARLAGWTKIEPTVAWLPFIGTCVHERYERLFESINKEETEAGRANAYLVEQRVTVGEIAGQPVTGSTDLYITGDMTGTGEGMTVDWKIVGKATLDKVKRLGEPSKQYQVQAHLYARGWNAAGYPTTHVCVYFQPRNAMSLNDGHIWIAPYDEQVAIDALERASRLKHNLDALETVSIEARDAWITSLSRSPSCWDCKKYPDYNNRNHESTLTGVLA